MARTPIAPEPVTDAAPDVRNAQFEALQRAHENVQAALADAGRENALMRTVLTVLCHQAGGSLRISRNEAALLARDRVLQLPATLDDESNYLLAGTPEQVMNLSMGV